MDARTTELTIDAAVAALVAFLQILAIAFHWKLPASIQAMLDAKMPAGGGSKPLQVSSRRATPAAGRYTVLPWRGVIGIRPQSQQAQTLPDGAEKDTWWNDCGETCASMVIEAVWGVNVPPDALRALYLGPRSDGLTTPTQLVDILHRNEVGAHADTWSKSDQISRISAHLETDRPVIALGRWPTPGGVLHWLLVTGVSGGSVYYINPWQGVRSYIEVADWGVYATGDYVVVDSHIHYDLDSGAIPF